MTLVTTFFWAIGMFVSAIAIAAVIVLTYTLFKIKRMVKQTKEDLELNAENIIEVEEE